jgi:hypothetical protein
MPVGGSVSDDPSREAETEFRYRIAQLVMQVMELTLFSATVPVTSKIQPYNPP